MRVRVAFEIRLLLSAYVTQDDTLAGVLTVYENLWYAAMLKLPQDMPLNEKEDRIKEVISDLGLTKVAFIALPC